MTPYAVSTGYIPDELVKKFHMIRNTFETLPDFEGEIITCHAICAALAECYNLTSIDGYFGTGNQHSWVIDQDYPNVIIDIYPINGAASFIVCKHWLLPWDKLYIPTVIEYDKVEYKRQIQKILSVI